MKVEQWDESELDRRLQLSTIAFDKDFQVHQTQYSFGGAVKKLIRGVVGRYVFKNQYIKDSLSCIR